VTYLTFVVLVVPALIGLAAAAALGPNRGSILGAGIMLVAVFVLLLFQVTPPAAVSRLGSAFGLMLFEWYRWVPSFLVGAAIGSLIFRVRRREPRP
jgi:hypothetical protein